MRKISIIIVSWNVCNDLVNCIDSIYKNQPSCNFEIIVVDNDSTDNTIETISSKFPEVILIDNKENLGFAVANNIGFKRAKGEHILILNPDTLILPDSIDSLINYIESNPKVGICGPKVLNSDGSIQLSVRGLPTWKAIFYRFTICKYLGIFRNCANSYRMKDFDYNNPADVDQLIGAALIARSEVVKKMNGFDERFFMYYEEVDLCKRIKDSGLKCVYYPDSEIIHLGGQSSSQVPAKTSYMTLKSLLLYMRKHNKKLHYAVVSSIFKLGIFLRNFLDLTIASVTIMLLFWDNRTYKKNKFKLKTSFNFLTKYYLRILFT